MKNIMGMVIFVIAQGFCVQAWAISWSGIFIAGDYSIENFDRARVDLTELLEKGADLSSTQFSSTPQIVLEQEEVQPAFFDYILNGFAQLRQSSAEGCFVHMTSHGGKDGGFYLALDKGLLPPEHLSRMVDLACGNKPTVILVSACYSGQFINEEIKGPNRVILTAAHKDRPSFGCSPDTRYTYWDGCLLEEIPNSTTWPNLYENVNACISAKEKAIGADPSLPQAFFGENTKEWPLLH